MNIFVRSKADTFGPYTFQRNAENYGPYTLEQIKQHLWIGTFSESDLAWYEGCGDWVTLKDIVASVSNKPRPPLPPLPVRVPLETNRSNATSDTAQPTDEKSGDKLLLSTTIVGLIIVIGFIIIKYSLYETHLTKSDAITGVSTTVNVPSFTLAPPANTGATSAPIIKPTAKLVGVYRNASDNKVLIALYDDNTYTCDDPKDSNKKVYGTYAIYDLDTKHNDVGHIEFASHLGDKLGTGIFEPNSFTLNDGRDYYEKDPTLVEEELDGQRK